MAIPRFNEDLAIISKLGDNPGSDNNLTTDAFRAKFDEGPLKIQDYLNNVLIPAAEQSSSPQEGLSMQGGINMNGHALNGLNAPTADDEAANKGYVDANKVDKSNVVNNFITTEEGFVADARALKVLNDTKLSTELLWENASPTSSFAAQTIPLNISMHTEVEIEFRYMTTYNSHFTQRFIISTNSAYMHMLGSTGGAVVRYGYVSNDGVNFGNANFNGAEDNTLMIPTKIYGIKGVSA